jgi:hypothetical protein
VWKGSTILRSLRRAACKPCLRTADGALGDPWLRRARCTRRWWTPSSRTCPSCAPRPTASASCPGSTSRSDLAGPGRAHCRGAWPDERLWDDGSCTTALRSFGVASLRERPMRALYTLFFITWPRQPEGRRSLMCRWFWMTAADSCSLLYFWLGREAGVLLGAGPWHVAGWFSRGAQEYCLETELQQP